MALVLLGYAAVLGVEFLFMVAANRRDLSPRASGVQVLQAWWGEVRGAPKVFCWRQPFRSQHWPDRLGAASRGRRGVVLVHGFVCNRGLWNPWLARLDRLGVPVVAVNLEPVFGSIDDYPSAIDAAVGRVEQATGLAPVMVGHSMGGLAIRRWWAGAGNDSRVHHAITIGTPHRGTWLARFALSPNGREMRTSSDWLRALAESEPKGRALDMTCFYGHCDNIVFPASSATVPGADNRHLPAVAHVHMADRPEPFDALMHWLRKGP